VFNPTARRRIFSMMVRSRRRSSSSKPWASTSSMASAAWAVARSMFRGPLPAQNRGRGEQAVGDAWRAAGAHGDLGGAVGVDGDVQDFGGAPDDETELVVGVELQAQQDAEAAAQRRRQQAGRVVAPTKVKGLISMTWVRAAGPWPMMMSSFKSSSAV